jgi:hypothetical protein
MQIGQQSKETMLIENFNIISFVFIKDITQVDLQQTTQKVAIDGIISLEGLNNIKTYQRVKYHIFSTLHQSPISIHLSAKSRKKIFYLKQISKSIRRDSAMRYR